MYGVADQQIKSVANFVARSRELRRFCARNCARMTTFLLAGRELAIDTPNRVFLS